MGPEEKDVSKQFDDEDSRIRAGKAMRRMRYLTGMAAIGGFLFGYDTGKATRVCRFVESSTT